MLTATISRLQLIVVGSSSLWNRLLLVAIDTLDNYLCEQSIPCVDGDMA